MQRYSIQLEYAVIRLIYLMNSTLGHLGSFYVFQLLKVNAKIYKDRENGRNVVWFISLLLCLKA